MTARCLRLPFALLLLGPALAGQAAEKDNYGDTLPEGAKTRVGTARLRLNTFTTPPLLSPDGQSLYAHSGSGLGRFDPATGAEQSKIANQHYTPQAFSGDGKRALYYSYDSTSVWDTETGKTVVSVKRRIPSSEYAAAISGDGKTLVLGAQSEPGKKEPLAILVWDVEKDKEISKIAMPHNITVNVAVSHDGKVVATWGSHTESNEKVDPEANPTRFAYFWNAADGKELAKVRTTGYMPSAIAFSPDGSVAAVSQGNSSVDLVDPKTGASKQILLGRFHITRAATFSPDGSTIAAVTGEGTVHRWKVADGSRLSMTEPPVANLYTARVRILNDEKGIAWSTKGTAVIVWEVPSGKRISPEGGHSGAIHGLAVTPDNKHLVTSAEDGTILKWELTTGKPAGEITLRPPYSTYSNNYHSAMFTPDFSHALVRDNYNGMTIFDVPTLTAQYAIPTSHEGYTQANFSDDGSRVVLASSHYDAKKKPARVTVWNTATSKRVASVELPGLSNVYAATSPDGKYIATVGRKPTEKGAGEFFFNVWDAATGEKKGEYNEEAQYGTPYVTVSPDSKMAVVATTKSELIPFELATGKPSRPFDLKGKRPGTAPVFSADGKKLAVCENRFGSEPATILVFDWESGKVKHTFGVPGGTPTCVIFSPDGKWLITGSTDTTATVWDVN